MLYSKLNLVLICVLIVLAACSGENQDDDSRSSPVPAATAASVPLQPLLIWHAYDGPAREALEQIRRDFEIAHPEVDLQLEYIEETAMLAEYHTAFNAAAGPDFVLGPATWLPPLLEQGTIQPINRDLFDHVTSTLTETMALAPYYENAPYAVPFSAEFAMLYYNRALVSTIPEDIEQWTATATAHGLLIPPTVSATSPFFLSLSSQIMDNDGNSELVPSALAIYLVELQRLASEPSIIFTSDPTEFVNGSTGMIIASTADYPAFYAALGDDLGVMLPPAMPPRQWMTLITSIQLVIQNLNTTAEAIQAGNLFISFLLSDDVQRFWYEQTSQAPANAAGIRDDQLRTALGYLLEWGITTPFAPEFEQHLQPLLDQAVVSVTLEGADPQETVDAFLAALESES